MTQSSIQLNTTPPYSGADAVDDTNKALQTIATDFAGTTDPAGLDGCGPYCTWADTANGLLKRRNAADTAWVVEGELFQYKANRNGDGTQNFNVASLNGGQLAGFRNKIINGNPVINQRGVSGTVTLAAGEYGHDRWKAGSGGCTYTFNTVENITTITISSGTLMQIIEGVNLMSGQHVLSWQGTAQGRVDSGSYGNSGEVLGTAVGGTNQAVEFSTGTLSLVQYESGTVPTLFEFRGFFEETLCFRYSELVNGYAISTLGEVSIVEFKAKKRGTPSYSGLVLSSGSGAVFSAVPNTSVATASNPQGCYGIIQSAVNSVQAYFRLFIDAEL
ncbi:hypothetical protein G9Q38_07285 [Pusillimonas sp. DMV24BSW_D]|uniref:hypothetical protein n=1 Tax=Neopusillimonas aestuarii TaxID=2716226 RepID=UPI00140E7BA4|nr:hypothetical protein [Pusillimonas sp. DMV24BSW_D]QIM48997.1 hypothetical protein G9Q38_07285 [Pusillimonas sp. DMV24BSW_D]